MSNGRLIPELAELAPRGERRMGANPARQRRRAAARPAHAGLSATTRSRCRHPAANAESSDARARAVHARRDEAECRDQRNFRVFGPDETASNRLGALFEVTNRCSTAQILPNDELLAPDGRVMEMLSEHQCQGWLEGYLLTGRHGFFSCYEAFIHIVDSMFNQHAKWLKVTATSAVAPPDRLAELPADFARLAPGPQRLQPSGSPGFIDHVVNKKAEVIRVYLPPDANTLLSVTDHCLRSRNYVNVIVAGKQPAPQWLDMDAAIKHCTAGIGIWEWASNDQGRRPDVVMACCGDVPTLETLAAVDILRAASAGTENPRDQCRRPDDAATAERAPARPVRQRTSTRSLRRTSRSSSPTTAIPWLIHRLTYRRTNHDNIHVRGYKEEGTTTTPFDMAVLNDLDRFHLVMDAIDRLPQTGDKGIYLKQQLKDKLVENKQQTAGRAGGGGGG